eukprot:10002782-Alexandrium_andersonii.AAC.1
MGGKGGGPSMPRRRFAIGLLRCLAASAIGERAQLIARRTPAKRSGGGVGAGLQEERGAVGGEAGGVPVADGRERGGL